MVLMHQFSYKPVSGNWLLKCGILFVFRFVSKYSIYLCSIAKANLHTSRFVL